MLLSLNEQSSEPLHGQISRQIRARILASRLAAGQGLPSIRELARDQRISVITVQRAYSDLEREGLIHARPGKGFFISPLSKPEKERLALERLKEALAPVVQDALAQGLSADQVRNMIEGSLKTTGAPK